MTAASSPLRIRAVSSSSVPSTSVMFGAWPNAPRSDSEAGDESPSAKPMSRLLSPPEKIAPNRKMKISGNASVQNIAARSRVKLLMLATVSRSSACIASSVPQGPAGKVEEHVLQRRPPNREVRRLMAQRLGRRQDRADRPGHVLRVEQDRAVLPLDGGDAGEPLHRPVVQARDGVEADGQLVEAAAHELADRPRFEDAAVVHDRQPIAEDLGLFHVVRRQ